MARSRLLRALAIVTLGLLATAALADLKVVTQVQMSINGDYHPTDYTTSYYSGKWVRIDNKHRSLITDMATHKTIDVDHLAKTYTIEEGDLASDAADMMKAMGAKIKATVSPTDQHKVIAGFNATEYLADFDFDMKLPVGTTKSVHLKLHMENWATSDLPVQAEAGSVSGAPTDMIASLLDLTGVEEVTSELKKIKGFSLSNKITTSLDSADVPAPIAIEIDYEAVSISQAAINPAMFRAPADYKKLGSDEDSDIKWRPAGKKG